MLNNETKLKEIIVSILEKIIIYSLENGYKPISDSDLIKLLKNNNIDVIINDVDINQFKAIYWEMLKEAYMNKENTQNYHFAEFYFSKGISLLIAKKAPSSEIEDLVQESANERNIKMPLLTIEALEYHYNNDKKTFSLY